MNEPQLPGFWKRQFGGRPTRRQEVHDLIFGIVLPLICLLLDPVVFRGGPFPVLHHYRWLAYTFIAIEMAVLAYWLTMDVRSGIGTLLLAGALAAGGLFALSLHAILLPLTLRGMIFLIGFLGLTPFLTSFVYFRNAWRAQSRYPGSLNWGSRIGILLAGMVLVALPSLGILYGIQGESLRNLVDAVIIDRPGTTIYFKASSH